MPKILFLLSSTMIVFTYGLVVGHYEVFPFSAISNMKDTVKQVIAEKDTLLGLRPSEFIEPARYEGSGVTRSLKGEAAPGYTFVTGFFDDSNEMRLVRMDGSVINKWPVKFSEIFPDPKHIKPAKEIPKSDWNASVHGSHLLPDGSVIFIFTYKGAAKIDRCGKLLWTIPRMIHHSIYMEGDGTFWTLGANYIDKTPGYPHLQVPYIEDTVIKYSPAGKVLKEISIVEILFKNGLQGFIYRKSVNGDLTHLNDVEVLEPEMAASYPQFSPGDLMLSMRKQDLVMVVDPETLLVKWYQQGPWQGQHDLDFMPNGIISMFSNNDDGTKYGKKFGGSTIVEIDPKTRKITRRYGAIPGEPMYTLDRGKHQRLGDNILITEARSGRVFEIDSKGKVVWDYINRYDDKNVLTLTGAVRYPASYFTVKDWSCNKEP